ncbi:uncharacterized protein TNCT_143561 [Trichonephila clavata]|uniref:Uncharacterized protein n=1 Tax=Trichonephila clavata TaxID=2740835 RepID=A0A8X6KXH4_TRICU|nr:uncharacterized protein TNCT_143561 [Trichonephila clavata]
MAMRGRILQPEHCIEYYQNQIGKGDPYFSSDFPIQRGYGFFSNLRRYALPLMIQAGKYLGKRLLTSGRNILLRKYHKGSHFVTRQEINCANLGEK